ncbi:unnamed protein product [Enterobius vermicularis]|uniref:MFS transporter n=1 Tax=Enterobius vermicularis TaxID=51028 RepID=A0A0N4V976_ENTVE|nr:unnamed protein product [Enterobius vermicularis]
MFQSNSFQLSFWQFCEQLFALLALGNCFAPAIISQSLNLQVRD